MLVLPKGHKAMVYSLVQAHFRDRQRVRAEDEMQADLIRGKGRSNCLDYIFSIPVLTLVINRAGKGLIILLHGAPGVGKTSTAGIVIRIFPTR